MAARLAAVRDTGLSCGNTNRQNRRKWRGELAAGDAEGLAGQSWRLVLPLDKPVSRTAAKRAAKAAAAGLVEEGATAVQTLDFLLDEVREARLVPLVDFKGRRGQGPEVDAEQDLGHVPEDQKVFGGQD